MAGKEGSSALDSSRAAVLENNSWNRLEIQPTKTVFRTTY